MTFDSNHVTMANTEAEDCDHVIKILALGDSLVGKSSFIHRYTDDSFLDDATPTIGIDMREKRTVYHPRDINANETNTDNEKLKLGKAPSAENTPTTLGKRIRLLIYDTAGQERYRSIATSFFRDAMGFFVVFDVTNESSFVNVRQWMTHLATHAHCERPPILLLGNKNDLPDEARQVEPSAISELSEQVGVPYFEVSALTGHNVDVAVEYLLHLVMEDLERRKMLDKFSLGNGATVKLRAGVERKFDKCACC